jgi:menaquinol-cytochrome c reductase cytochrome b/c subunit
VRRVVLAAAILGLALAGAGCGSDEDEDDSAASVPAQETPTVEEISIAVPKRLEAGKRVAAQTGCLACHRIGENGNDGPGPELTEIGAQLPRRAIDRTLKAGPGIMPSYANLPRRKQLQLTAFLASLD